MANIIQDVITLVDNSAVGLTSAIYVELATTLAPFLRNMFIISLVVFGLMLMLGWVQYPIGKLLKTLFKMVTVWALFTNWAWFDIFFYKLFTNSPDNIGASILSAVGTPGASTSDSVAAIVGVFYEKGMISVGKIFANSGLTGIGNYFIGAFLGIAVILVSGYTLALIVISKMGMTVVLALAPIFFIFLMFESTKQMFSSWLQQLFNFAFIAILTYTFMAFFITILTNSILLIPDNDINFGDITPALIVCMVASFILVQVMGIASGLAGGVQMSTLGTFAAMRRAGSQQFGRMRRSEFGSRMKGTGLAKGWGRHLLGKAFNRGNAIKGK